jgi:hypothetical protein
MSRNGGPNAVEVPPPRGLRLPGSGSMRSARRFGLVTAVLALVVLAVLPSGPTFADASTAPQPAGGTHAGAALPVTPSGSDHPAVRPIPPLAVRTSAPPTVVNPFAAYGTTGRAPYGIADFGVSANGTGYRYNTTSFLGTIDIRAMDALATVDYRGNVYQIPGDTVQLNTILVLQNGSQTEDYWIQNVPFFSPPNDGIDLEDNIWNMSTTNALPTNSVVGNGTIDSGSVYIASASRQPGNNVSLGFPANVSVKLITGTAAGIPYVLFEYDDGYGWQTYDNASFPWAHGGWTDQGFVVDGTQYLPNGLFFDTEWVYGGPGDGLTSDNLAANFSMTLDFFNGHNYQAVPNAFNFGSDTGEAMENVLETSGPGGAGPGAPGATLTVGNSDHAFLYGRADVAIVNVSSPIANTTVSFGALKVPFKGDGANVTLSPGPYLVRLWNGSAVAAERNITVTAGEYLHLVISLVQVPNAVTFKSHGLPGGRSWTVVVGNVTYHASGSALDLELVNGTYPYSIVPIAGFTLPSYQGTLEVAGQAVSLTFDWSWFVFPVAFSTVGLPNGVPWSVSILSTSGTPGGNVSSSGGNATVELANGSYDFAVSVGSRYEAVSGADSFAVLGVATGIEVQFVLRYGYLVGSVHPATASVDVNGTSLALQPNGAFNTSLDPGRYLVIASGPGYVTYDDNVTITPGNATALSVRLVPSASPTPTPTSSGSTSPLGVLPWYAWGAIALVVVAGIAIALSRRRR